MEASGEPPADEIPVRKASGTIRIELSAIDEAGRRLMVGIPLKHGGARLELTPDVAITGIFPIGIPTQQGVKTKIQPHPIPVDPQALLAEAVAEAFDLYDNHIEAAKVEALAEVMGKNRLVLPTGSMPPH